MTTMDQSGRQKLAASSPVDRWDDWTEVEPRALPEIVEHHYTLVPTVCFNCEAARGLLA